MALRVTQTSSAIGVKPKQRGTLRALGLRRIGHSNDLPDRPEIRGMLAKVPHLVSVQTVGEADDVTADDVAAEANDDRDEEE